MVLKCLKLSIFVLIFFSPHSTFSLNEDLFLRDITEPLNDEVLEAVNLIFEKVFVKAFQTVNIITSVEDPLEPHFMKFKTALLRKNKESSVFCFDDYNLTMRTDWRTFNVFLIDSIQSFEVLFKHITKEKFNSRGKFLFVPINGKLKGLDRVFEAMWSRNIFNVNAILEVNGAVRVVTFFPFKANSCGDTTPVFWDEFQNGSFGKEWKKIFPSKLRNMQRCPIRLVTFDRCPATCVEQVGDVVKVSGFDMGIIEVIAERLNFTLETTVLLGPEQWGSILPNKTTTGAILRIIKNESDIAIGSYILRRNRVEIMDSSMVYFSFPIVFAIPLGVKLTSFEKLMRPYDFPVWICLLIILGFGMIVVLLLNMKLKKVRAFVYGKGVTTPVINMAIAVFGGSQKLLPQRNFARFILMMFLIFCLVQRNVYQGLLYNFLKSDGRKKEVQTIDEMVSKGFQFKMFESYVDIIQNIPKIYDNRKIVKTEDKFVESLSNGEAMNFAFMTQITDVIHRNKISDKSTPLKVCKERILTANIVMYFPKNYYLRESVDARLKELQTTGILEFWTQKYADKRFLNIKPQHKGPTKMEISQLAGVFNLWFIGLGISIIVFVFELTHSSLNSFKNTKGNIYIKVKKLFVNCFKKTRKSNRK